MHGSGQIMQGATTAHPFTYGDPISQQNNRVRHSTRPGPNAVQGSSDLNGSPLALKSTPWTIVSFWCGPGIDSQDEAASGP